MTSTNPIMSGLRDLQDPRPPMPGPDTFPDPMPDPDPIPEQDPDLPPEGDFPPDIGPATPMQLTSA